VWPLLRYFRSHSLIPWFKFSRGLRLIAVKRISRRTVPKTEIYVFTAWETAIEAGAVRGHAPMVDLVWDYEFWAEGDDDLRRMIREAFAQPGLILIAGSSVVRAMLDEMGLLTAATVPPGLNHETFRVRRDPSRRPLAVGLLLRPMLRKGLADALGALTMLRDSGINPRVLAVGRWYEDLPAWVEHRSAPTDDDLAAFYNEVSIFVFPSRIEGFGLPAAEAMACGAAVVTTSNGGTAEFARHEQNALVVPPACPSEMSATIGRLVEDDDLRVRLALAGVHTAAMMRWDESVDRIEQFLRLTVAEGRKG
jgi:glycosyltransferase involved in cell wall biosynthesis